MADWSPWYTTGTVAIANVGTTVTGVGTNFHTAGLRPGDMITNASMTAWAVITATPTTATSLAITSWGGAALPAGSPYRILRVSDADRLIAAHADLMAALVPNLTSLGGLTLAANKGLHATGAGALALHDLTAYALTLLAAADADTARSRLSAGGLAAANTWGANQRINARLGINTPPTYWLDAIAPAGVQNITRVGQQGLSNGLQISSDGASMAYLFTLTGPDAYVRFSGLKTTASAANATLDGPGTLLRSTSSLVYKKDIENLESWRADDLVRLARPVWYRSKAAADRPDWGYYGLIAEEVAAIDPRLVHWAYQADQYEDVKVPETVEETVQEEGIDGQITTRTIERTVMRTERQLKEGAELRPDGVQYDRITVMLLDVARRQAETIADLQASVASIEARLAALEG